MKLLEITLLCSLVLTANGCTVLGFATDLALSSARADNNDNSSQNELIFTTEGMKHDAKFIKQLVTEAIKSRDTQSDNESLVAENANSKTLMCENVQGGQQQCYPPEYYEDMYIKVDTKNKQDTTSTEN
ncbi:hypothetical protein [Paraglaciecola arctica]|uniref:hypothetical protein n=1 Tax=Paraglaciecola arctica TaxID=1128911 RepID=UPI001C076A6C|nr:hypothetical protein [Paraglaciecola arctica]MBU3005668.1 hypothetical protein [Paraglaciecola arctica]